ncbi:unnamed protein product [Cyprideis torosa]|uniref:glutathione-disulfide reductase n=1 Tax=Cyprideis torosa TaxID=163714 RepID=A0A7R8WZU9_9CRUS|nr:unnamed protein product [Cyprideis torosa]CAG0910216.1 unnamed protein product [Cyprideis torosa]
MPHHGVTLHRQSQVERIERRGDERLVYMNNGEHIVADCVIVAVGRSPNVATLGLESTGVEQTPSGHIIVDEWQATAEPQIFALGDVTGPIELTPVAIAAGRRLSDRLFGGHRDARMDYENVATVIFSHPPIGTVGLGEQEANERHGHAAVTVYRSRFVNMRYATSEHKPATLMKLVCVGPEQRVIGCHIVGDHADEMIQGFAVAVKMGATKADFDRTVAIHPTAAEELVTMRLSIMPNAVVRARIDESVKDEASAVLAAMGLTVSDAFRLMMMRIANDKALPFEPLVPNQTTIEAMKAARRGDTETTSLKEIESILHEGDPTDAPVQA